MADSNFDLKLNAQTGAFEKGMGAALGSFNKFTGGIFQGGNVLKIFSGTVTALGGSMVALAVKTASTADDMLKLSDQTGIAVEVLSLWRDVVAVSDSNAETLSKGLIKLQQVMGDAAGGAIKQAEAFEAAGVSIVDSEGQLRGTKDVLLELADLFETLPEGPTQTALAMKIFGKSGVELIPFLSNGSKGIQELSDKFEGMGRQMSGELAQASSEFNDQMDYIAIRAKGAGETIGKFLIPKLADLLKWFDSSIESERGFLVSEADIYEAMVTGSREAITGKKEVVAATEEEIRASEQAGADAKKRIDLVMSRAAREKEAAVEAKAAAAEIKEIEAEIDAGIAKQTASLVTQLELKRGFKNFDQEYFALYASLLNLQGVDNEIIQLKIAQDIQSRAKSGGEAEADYANKTIKELKKIIKAEETTGKQRIKAGEKLAEKQEEAAEENAEEIRDVLADNAGNISQIWDGTGESFKDTWRNAATGFIDSSIQMVIQSGIASAAIQMQTAAATAGITILISLMAKAFGRGGGSDTNSELEQARQKLESSLDTFLDSIDSALEAFLSETTTALESLDRQTDVAKVGLETLIELTDQFEKDMAVLQAFVDEGGFLEEIAQEAMNALSAKVRTEIIEHLDDISGAIQERYGLEKRMINEVRDMMESQADFAKDIQGNITDVARALLNPEEMFEALLGDVATLQGVVASTSGEAQIEALGDLQEAFNSVFGQAQDLFADDPEELARWQDFVLEGLQGIEASGNATFDNLIDTAVAQLNMTERTNDLTADILNHEARIDAAQFASLTLLRVIAAETDPAGVTALVDDLLAQLAVLGIVPTVALAHGALVTRPTTALIAEAGPEWVISPEKAEGMFGGGGASNVTVVVNLPNVRDFRDITDHEAEQILRGPLTRAGERLNRAGHDWPLAPRPDLNRPTVP